MMKRRTFLKRMLAFAAWMCVPAFSLGEGKAAPVCPPGRAVRPHGYPGCVVPLDESALRRVAPWLG